MSSQSSTTTADKATVDTSDETLADLQTRYKMDAKIWQQSKRGFPFNIPLGAILTFALGGPILLSLWAFDLSN